MSLPLLILWTEGTTTNCKYVRENMKTMFCLEVINIYYKHTKALNTFNYNFFSRKTWKKQLHSFVWHYCDVDKFDYLRENSHFCWGACYVDFHHNFDGLLILFFKKCWRCCALFLLTTPCTFHFSLTPPFNICLVKI